MIRNLVYSNTLRNLKSMLKDIFLQPMLGARGKSYMGKITITGTRQIENIMSQRKF